MKNTAKNILDVAEAIAYNASHTNNTRSDFIGFGVSINKRTGTNGENTVFNKLNQAINPATNINKIKLKVLTVPKSIRYSG